MTKPPPLLKPQEIPINDGNPAYAGTYSVVDGLLIVTYEGRTKSTFLGSHEVEPLAKRILEALILDPLEEDDE